MTKRARTFRAVIAGGTGNVVEWYDWGAYATFAVFISRNFFPAGEPAAALISTFAVFAVGFLARPIGSITLGRVTDRVGRRATLTLTVLIMSGTSFLIGFAPTYSSIGLWATVYIVVIRLIQGLALGAESSAVGSFLIESAGPSSRGRLVAVYGSTISVGTLLGALVGLILTTILTTDQLDSFGWRIPFLVGGALGLVAFLIRRGSHETLDPDAIPREKPVRTLIRSYPRVAWRVMVLAGVYALIYFTLVAAFPSFAQALGALPSTAYAANAVGLIVLAILCPVFGFLSDRWGRRPVLLLGYVGCAIVVIPVVAMLWDPSTTWRVYAAQILVVIPFAAIQGAVLVTLLEQLPPSLRGVGFGFLWAASMAVFGGTGPLIGTWLAVHGITVAMDAYVLAFLALAILVTVTMHETAFAPMEEDDPNPVDASVA